MQSVSDVHLSKMKGELEYLCSCPSHKELADVRSILNKCIKHCDAVILQVREKELESEYIVLC